jgi:Family of unknown function (DUF6263)
MLGFRSLMWHTGCLLAVCNAQYLMAQTDSKTQDSKAESTVVVELIEAGKSPRQQLRFAPKAGDKISKIMSTKMKQTITMAGRAAPSPEVPAQNIYIDMEVKGVNSNGDIEFEFRYVDVKLDVDPAKPSPIAGQIETMLKPLIGTKGSGTITNRGLTKQAEFEVPEDLNPMIKTMLDGMKDSLNQLASPLPEEAVGVGGKWKTVQNISANGLKLKQTSINEVTSLESTGFSLKVTIEQQAEPQEIKNAMLPPGASMKLDSLSTTGQGQSQFSLNEIFPKSSKVVVNSKTAMAISIAGQNQNMSTNMEMEMTLEDAPKK